MEKKYVVNVQRMTRKISEVQGLKPDQRNLQNFLKVSQPTLSKWKSKTPNMLSVFKKYCDATGDSFENIIEEK